MSIPQLYGHFKRQTREILYEKTKTHLRKGNLKKEPESLLIAAQNNTTSINHIYPTPPHGQDMTQGQFLSGV